MKKYFCYSIIIALGLAFSACQKVINVDLNSASPVIVITGNVSDQPGPYTVTLSQTVNFDQSNTFPAVSAAFVSIADNTGDVDTLKEISPGNYQTTHITGVPGRTYTLTVIADGKTYTSVSTMPQPVALDTILLKMRVRRFDTTLIPEAVFQDPAGLTNYYRFIETVNGQVQSKIFSFDDEHTDGDYITYSLRSDNKLYAGDVVSIELQSIDSGTYNYLRTFKEASGSTNSQTPFNPISNISNNALGYFSAHASRVKVLVVP